MAVMRFLLLLLALFMAAPAAAQMADAPAAFVPEPSAKSPSPAASQAAAHAPAGHTVEKTAKKSSAPSSAAPQGPMAMLGGGTDGKDQYLDITADQSLEWHENESLYIARGHAVAKRGTMQVKADVLKAYNRKKPDGSSEVFKMTAQGNVEISDKDHVATGDAGEYDIDTKKATLTGTNLRFTSGQDVVTAKDSFIYLEGENKIIASGNTRAIRDGRQVDADTMTAYLMNNKTGGQDIDHMEAKGNVHIVTTQDAVLCDDAVYNLAQNSAVLTGHVKITRGENQLRGDKVVADFKTGRSKLINTGTGRVSALIIGGSAKPGGKKPGSGIMPVMMPGGSMPKTAPATP